MVKHALCGGKTAASVVAELRRLRLAALELYDAYKNETISQSSFIDAMRPIDEAIDALELQLFSCALQGTPLFEKAFAKHLR